MKLFVVVCTALVIAYLGQILKTAADAGQWWVFIAALPAAIALGYAVGSDYDRKHMWDTLKRLTGLLRR